MNKKRVLLLLLIPVLLLTGCKRLSIRIEDDEGARTIPVPFTLLRAALTFSGGQAELDLSDMIDTGDTIDLKMFAKALKENADKVRVEGRTPDGLSYSVRADRGTFRLLMDNPEEEQKMQVNLPMKMMDLIAEAEDGRVIEPKDIMRSFRGWRGVLVEVEDPYEKVRIAVK